MYILDSAYKLLLFIVFALFSLALNAAPGDTLFSDNFERGNSQRWSYSDRNRAGIGRQTANSGRRSAYLYSDTVTATSRTIDTDVGAASLSLWIRRGADSFSEDPDNNEDLLVQYRNNSSTWITLATFAGNGTPGETYSPSYPLPADALHSGFQIRLYFLQGSGGNYDYWHFDDVTVTEEDSGGGTLSEPIGEWRFDEVAWDGTTDEVRDYSCNGHSGTSNNVSLVSGLMCGAADLSANSTNDYIQLDGAVMDGLSDFTISVWVKTNNRNDSTLISAASGNGSRGANEAVWYFSDNRQFWPTITASPFDEDTRTNSNGRFNDNVWHHLVWTRSAGSRRSCFYVDGSLISCTTHPDGDDGNPLSVLEEGLFVGQEQDSVGGGFDRSQDWEGLIDELMIFDSSFSNGDVSTLYQRQANGFDWNGDPRVCGHFPCSQLDHFDISMSPLGVTCEAEPVTITALDIDGNPVAPDAGHVITLTTSPSADGWSLVIGGGSLSDLGSGQTRYTFDGAETEITLGLQRLTPTPAGSPINIDIIDSDGVTESAGADPSIAFVDSAFRFYADGIPSAIGAQLAGKESNLAPGDQNLTLRAVRTDANTGACVARITGPQAIEMAFECDNPSSCKTNNGVSILGTPVPGNAQGTVNSYNPVNLVFDASGSAPFTFNYRDAGQIALHARKQFPATNQQPAFTLVGNSNIFTTSPAGLCIETSDSGSDCAPSFASCSKFIKAGENFNLSVRAVTWESFGESNSDFCAGSNSVTPNFSLNSIAIDENLLAPAGGNNGSFSTASINIASGDDGEVTFQQQYSEVGTINAVANPQLSYFGETIGASVSDPIGRFYPARFVVTANTPVLNNACEGVNTTAFTYLGQEPVTGGFGFALDPVFTITAENLNGGFTQNYGGDFWKLDTTLVNRTFVNEAVTASSLSREVTGTTVLNGDDDFDATPPEITLSDSRFMYSLPGTEEAPFNALIDLNLQPSDLTDSDGVCYSLAGNQCNTTEGGAAQGFTIEDMTGALLRFGKGFGQDNYGTMGNSGEYIDVTIGALYWNGNQWVVNTDDGCTNGGLSYSSAETLGYSKADSGVSTATSPAPPLTLSGGKAVIRVTLQSDTSGGQTVVNPTWPSWLTGESATAHFGIYRGDDRFIYWREVE